MKLKKLSSDLLQYLRANLIFSYPLDEQSREHMTVSTPVDTKFECYCIDHAVKLIENMMNTKYLTSLDHDLKLFEQMSGNDQGPEYAKIVESKGEHLWRFKLALIHRVTQKEILHYQYKCLKILHKIMTASLKLIEWSKANDHKLSANDFKKLYLAPAKEFGENEDAEMIIKNRLVLRHYLYEYLDN